MNLLVIAILITSEISLILAHLGAFCVWPIFVSLLIMYKLRPSFTLPPVKSCSLERGERAGFAKGLVPVIAIALFLFFQPYQYMDGGWDPGNYINTGVHIADTGGVIYKNDIVDEYPGLYVKDRDKGLVVPQFFHLYPVWIAIFYKLFGLRGIFYVNPFFALLNVILLFLITKKLMGKPYGVIAALLLCLNVIEIWNARFPISEILSQFLLLAGFYFLLEDKRRSLFWAGVSFGEFLLVNITSVLIIPVLLIYLIYRHNRKDIYFIIPFLFLLSHLVIQLCTYSPIYLENVIRFFQRKELYLLFILFIAFLVLYKKISYSLAFILPLLFIYGYFIRPHVSSNIEALNLVELGNCLSLLGLVLCVIGFMFIMRREKNEGLLLFIIIALVYAVFFLYDKRMNTRYPFSFRRYSAVVIPAYCFSISYLCYFLKGRLKFLSAIFIPLLITTPIIRNRDVLLVNDHKNWPGFWSDFANNVDNNSLYVCNSYRWARPLRDIFGKRVTADKGFIEKADYYISHSEQPYSLSRDFIEVYRKTYSGDYLEHSMTFPPRVKKMDLSLKVYKISDIGPLDKDEYLIDIGEEDIGLLTGFDKARRFGGIEGTARWTFGEASLVIPWPAETLTIMACGMPEEAGESVISLYIDGQPVVRDYRIGEEMKEYEFQVYGGTADIGNVLRPGSAPALSGRRAVLTVKANTWSPSKYGMGGFPDNLGILLDWISIKRWTLQSESQR